MSARHLSTAERQRLVALLGMLGSDHPGEVQNAARLAEKFRRQYGMTWEDLLDLEAAPASEPPKPEPPPRPKPQPEPPRHRAQQPPDDASYSERVKFWEASWAAKQRRAPLQRERERLWGIFWLASLVLTIMALATHDPNAAHPTPRPSLGGEELSGHHVGDPMKAALPRIGHLTPASH